LHDANDKAATAAIATELKMFFFISSVFLLLFIPKTKMI